MAKELGDLIVRLSLDSSKFEDGLKRFESQMAKVQGQFKSATTGITDFDKVTAKLKTSADTLTERMGLQKEKVAQLEKAYEASKAAKGEDAEETQKLAQRLEEARGKLDQTEKALKLVNDQVKLNQNGWHQLGMNLEGVGGRLEAVGKSIASAGKKLSLTVTAPVVALGVKSLQAGIEFESAFAGVRKTVNASEEEFKRLSQSVKDMSEVIPATTTELSGIMELAGQLGVDTGNLEKFTKTIAALGVSTNLTNESAAEMLAQFANITGMKLDNIDRLGSVIVALGNNFATTEASIVQMGQRLAGAGSQIGLSEAQIMAIATALSSVGIEAEAGGSAFSKLMVNMKVAAETGSIAKEKIASTGKSLRELELLADKDSKAFKKLASGLGLTSTELKSMMSAAGDLDRFAQVAGMSADQFAKAYGENAAEALTQFLAGLKSIDENGGSAIVTLDEMGITEVRLRDAILRASSATDLFTAAQELANTAWDDNTALQNEANQRYATTESRMQMLKNAANNVAISFSEVMLPTLEKLMDKLRGVTDWLKNLSDEQKKTVVKVAAFAAALGPVLLVVGKVSSGIGSLMKVIAPLAKALGGAQASTGAFGAALTALSGPIGWVIAAVAALAAVFAILWNTNEAFRAKMTETWDKVMAALVPVKEMFMRTFESVRQAMEPVKDSLGKLWLTVQEAAMKLWNLLEPLFIALGVVIGGFVTVIIGAANGILHAIGPLLDAVVNGVEFIMNLFSGLISLLQGDFAGAWESLKAAFASLWDVVLNVFSAIGSYFAGFWEGIKTVCAAFGLDLQSFFNGLWTGLRDGAVAAWTSFTAWISGAWSGICETAAIVWNGLLTFLSGLWTNIRDDAAAAWDAFVLWMNDMFNGICATASTILNGLLTFLSGLWASITEGATLAWNQLIEWLAGVWNGLTETATTAWNAVSGAITGVLDSASKAIENTWNAIRDTISGVWDGLKTTATTAWNTVCTNISTAVNTGKTWISAAWDGVKTAVTGVWDTVKTTATTAWDTVCSNVKNAVDGAKAGIASTWDDISTGISSAWDTFKTTASTAWGGITGGVKSAIDGAKSGIVDAWETIKAGVKDTWDGITSIFKDPIDSASTWLTEKVEWFKGLFNFQWKLPEFKLPKIEVKWNEVGWGISIPTLSLNWNALGGIFQKPTIFNTSAGLQGVGEAGPEAILPLNTLWAEMSVRLKEAMAGMFRDMRRADERKAEDMARMMAAAMRAGDGIERKAPSVSVTQNIYANETSYVAQQREAARNFRQIARAMG